MSPKKENERKMKTLKTWHVAGFRKELVLQLSEMLIVNMLFLYWKMLKDLPNTVAFCIKRKNKKKEKRGIFDLNFDVRILGSADNTG